MLYLVRIEKLSECFYKVGHSCDVTRRVKELSNTTGGRVTLLWKSPLGWNCDKVESLFHKDYKRKSYNPKIRFIGGTECYTQITPAVMRKYIKGNIHLVKRYDDRWSDVVLF